MDLKSMNWFCGAFLAGCAATYTPPAGVSEGYLVGHSDPAEALVRAGRVLASKGYQVDRDTEAGVLTTNLRNRKLTPAEADCGSTMGIDYLKDQRTTTKVGYSVVAVDNGVKITAVIEGEYKPGAVSQDLSLECVSRGALERRLASDL